MKVLRIIEITVVLIIFVIGAYSEATAQCHQLDLAIVVDCSGSMKPVKEDVQHATSRLLMHLGDKIYEDGFNVSLIEFSSQVNMLAQNMYDVSELWRLASVIPRYTKPNMTDLTAAMEEARYCLEQGRYGVPKMIVVITDGSPNNEYNAIEKARQIKDFYWNKGIVDKFSLVAVWITDSPNSERELSFLRNFATETHTTGIEDLALLLRNLNYCL